MPDVVAARKMSPGAQALLSDAGVGWVDEAGAAEISFGAIIVLRSGSPDRREAQIYWLDLISGRGRRSNPVWHQADGIRCRGRDGAVIRRVRQGTPARRPLEVLDAHLHTSASRSAASWMESTELMSGRFTMISSTPVARSAAS